MHSSLPRRCHSSTLGRLPGPPGEAHQRSVVWRAHVVVTIIESQLNDDELVVRKLVVDVLSRSGDDTDSVVESNEGLKG